jgi:carboxymethylenebutenolidase
MQATHRIFLGILALLVAAMITGCISQPPVNGTSTVARQNVTITSGGLDYPAVIVYPVTTGRYPGIVLIHSINGLDPGYVTMADRLAAQGYVVMAPQWQTYARLPPDDTVEEILHTSVAYLRGRSDVNASRLGLTGFCIGGRYTMLFAPQVKDFGSAVAWYGFPYTAGANQTAPADHIPELDIPVLIIHGSRDAASNVTDIYRYAQELDAAGRYFELKVYQGQPHGFMVVEGQLSESVVAQDAFREMVGFFDRTLR